MSWICSDTRQNNIWDFQGWKKARPALTWCLNLLSTSLPVALWLLLKYLQWWGTHCSPVAHSVLGNLIVFFLCNLYLSLSTFLCVRSPAYRGGNKTDSRTWELSCRSYHMLAFPQALCLQTDRFWAIWSVLQETELQALHLSFYSSPRSLTSAVLRDLVSAYFAAVSPHQPL